MKTSFVYLVVMFGAVLALGSCMRNDDEPTFPSRPIARLYVSVENIQTNEAGDPIANVLLIDPADTLEMKVALSVSSGVLGGAGIHFNPFIQRLFQGANSILPGTTDSTLRLMTVGARGQLGASGSFAHIGLNSVRGLAFNEKNQFLYVANNSNPTTIYGFFRPQNQNRTLKPQKVYRLADGVRPWAVVRWQDSLLVSNSGPNPQVLLYGGFSKTDSLNDNFQPISTINIQGVNPIRGIAYEDSLDVLIVADYGLVSDGGRTVNGAIHIFEGIKSKLSSGTLSTASPTRTIQGANTGLIGPNDVAIDPRDKRKFIFVADRDSRRISRFKLTDEGNVTPENYVLLDTLGNQRRPFGIFLDVRGVARD